MKKLREEEQEKNKPKVVATKVLNVDGTENSYDHEMRKARLADVNIPILWKIPDW